MNIRKCPSCGFPHERPFSLPRAASVARIQPLEDDTLGCQVCGSEHDRWMWDSDLLDGEFEWPGAEARIRGRRGDGV